MDLAAYLDRVGFSGTPRPDRATLDALQRAHMLAIPYENLDVQLGRPGTIDPAAAFEKLVNRRRGGWCYEMNGVFGSALAEIGFDVTRVEGAVMRTMWGEMSKSNHLVLWVRLPEGPVLADVGLGCGPLRPFDIAPSSFGDEGFGFSLGQDPDGWWRLTNHPGLNPPTFDFHLTPAREEALEAKCQFLRTDPQSPFVQNLIAQRYLGHGAFQILLGRTWGVVTPEGRQMTLIDSADELVEVLADRFGIDEPAAAGLWDRVCARHEALAADAEKPLPAEAERAKEAG